MGSGGKAGTDWRAGLGPSLSLHLPNIVLEIPNTYPTILNPGSIPHHPNIFPNKINNIGAP